MNFINKKNIKMQVEQNKNIENIYFHCKNVDLKQEIHVCYSVQTILSSRLLSKNLKIKIYKTIVLPVVL